MFLPQFPTDNLYKFIFIAGLTIMGATTFLYIEKFGEINNKLDNIETDLLNTNLAFYSDSIKNSFEIENINIILDRGSEEIKKLNKYTKLKNQKSVIKPRLDKLDDDMLVVDKLLSQQRKFVLENKISSHIDSVKLDHKLKKLEEENKLLFWFSIFCGIIFFCGFKMSVYGYRMWNRKVQKIIDEQLICELEKIRREIT